MSRMNNCFEDTSFRDKQGVLNDQFHAVSYLFTGICLCFRTLSYNKAMFWYSNAIWLARSLGG